MTKKLVSSSNKRRRSKRLPIDRLSALPDSLLISILSFLSTREAAMTGVLSKRWQFLWTDLPNLEFEDFSIGTEKISKFVGSVHKTLAICGGNHLKKFEVCFDYDKCFASDVNAWVQFVVKHKVKDVALLLNPCSGDRKNDWYVLPQMMYCNSSLTCLNLQWCFMAPGKSIEWGSLTTFSLEKMELRENVIENILSGCPVLDDLNLVLCWGLNCLDIKSQSVRTLTIIGDWEYETDGSFLEISAPDIHYLTISVFPDGTGTKFRFTNISSHVSANIDLIRYNPDARSVELMSYTKELFENLQHVKELEVGHEFVKALSALAVEEGMRLPQSGREYLKIDALRVEASTPGPGIVCLLESSPNLKTLFINLRYGAYQGCFPYGPAASYLQRGDLSRDLLHLKTVNITGYKNRNLFAEPMLTLVQLLLKRATVLEKMMIDFASFSSRYASSDYIKLTQKLLSYPRSSTKAVITLAPVAFFC